MRQLGFFYRGLKESCSTAASGDENRRRGKGGAVPAMPPPGLRPKHPCSTATSAGTSNTGDASAWKAHILLAPVARLVLAAS